MWFRVAGISALAVALVAMLVPPRPSHHLAIGLSLLLGALAGTGLCMVATRRLPRLPKVRNRRALVVAKQSFLGLCAANEEVIWRRVALGELLRAGALVALIVSAAAFALAHRQSRPLHLVTGSAFGGLYLGTGCLMSSVAAHWAYNMFLSALVERKPM